MPNVEIYKKLNNKQTVYIKVTKEFLDSCKKAGELFEHKKK